MNKLLLKLRPPVRRVVAAYDRARWKRLQRRVEAESRGKQVPMRNILALAWPAILEQILWMVAGVVSTILVSRLSAAAVSAVGVVGQVFNVIGALFTIVSTGGTVLIARLIGQRDLFTAKEALKQIILLSAGLSLVVMALCLAAAYPILKLFMGSAEADVFAQGMTYFRLLSLSLPFFILNSALSGVMRGSGDTKTPLYIAILGNAVHLSLAALFIFGLDMGVAGAGLALTLARVVGGALPLLLILSGKGNLGIRVRSWKLRLDTGLIRRISHIGLPATYEQVVMQLGFLLMQTLVVGMGTLPCAAYQIGGNITSLLNMPIFGLNVAVTTLVGQSLGEDAPDKADAYARKCLRLSTYFILTLGVAIFLAVGPLTALYTGDLVTQAATLPVARLLMVSMAFSGVINVMSGALRAAGDNNFIFLSTGLGIWVARIGLTLLLHFVFQMGILSAVYAQMADFGLRSVLYLVRWRQGKWRTLKI